MLLAQCTNGGKLSIKTQQGSRAFRKAFKRSPPWPRATWTNMFKCSPPGLVSALPPRVSCLPCRLAPQPCTTINSKSPKSKYMLPKKAQRQSTDTCCSFATNPPHHTHPHPRAPTHAGFPDRQHTSAPSIPISPDKRAAHDTHQPGQASRTSSNPMINVNPNHMHPHNSRLALPAHPPSPTSRSPLPSLLLRPLPRGLT